MKHLGKQTFANKKPGKILIQVQEPVGFTTITDLANGWTKEPALYRAGEIIHHRKAVLFLSGFVLAVFIVRMQELVRFFVAHLLKNTPI